jgi:hypothetical protein
MTICKYETSDGQEIEFNVDDCRSVADTVMTDMVDAHNIDSGDFWIVSQMVIQNILDFLQSDGGMDDDATMDYILDFIKKGEEH